MSVADVIARRGITEIVHFTPEKGLLGILAAGAALSRVDIHDEEILEYIAEVNSKRVLDPGDEGCVNLSITEINSSFFGYSTNWRPGTRWVVLGWDPVILTHPGVVFVTTNNAYS